MVYSIQFLISLAKRIAVVGPLFYHHNSLPGIQANHTRNQMIVARISRIEIPGEARRIPQTVSPYFPPRAGF